MTTLKSAAVRKRDPSGARSARLAILLLARLCWWPQTVKSLRPVGSD